MLLPAMHWVVNAVCPGLLDSEVALYRYWIGWRTSNKSAPVKRLKGEVSASSLHSSAPALLPALRTRLLMDPAPYLN